MNSINRSKLILGGLGLLVFMCSSLYLEIQLTGHFRKETKLASNIGSIIYLDEVLTMSARMAASSRNPDYIKRYYNHEKVLTDTIAETFDLVSNHEAEQAVASTEDANNRLIEMEETSFSLGRAGNWGEALELLESDAYQEQKAIYLSGMQLAFKHLEKEANNWTMIFKSFAVFIQFVIIINALFILRLWKKSIRSQSETEKKSAELKAFKATMHTVNDTINNALNNLIYIKLKAQTNSNKMTDEDWKLYDQIIEEASSKLSTITSIKEIKTKNTSGFEMLDIKNESSQSRAQASQ